MDVAISGFLGGAGLSVAGSLKKGNIRGAAVGAGIGFYLKKVLTPFPVTVGSRCECEGNGNFIDGVFQ
jgi:hypothetical protein